ncbi:MAG: cation diffusion facilitator family transporter [Candidatus Methanomethylicaceae archaeon]
MALSSVVAAIALTSMKLIVGIITNSLGILSEALHSGIDLIAAFTTFYAVKKSEAPPDSLHMYGHAKIESLASLVETVLLFLTCVWIVYEAISRLLFKTVEVDLGLSALAVMVISMGVDFSRSRALMRTAKEYRSQALEADAIHFSTDLISSAVVIIGILISMVGFEQFDSIAGLGVAAVTAFIGYRLLKKSAHTLLDGAPAGVVQKIIENARSVEGIQKVGRIRVREAGAKTFVDLEVHIDRDLNLEAAHELAESVCRNVQEAIPGADVVVHAEPISTNEATLVDKMRREASKMKEIKSISKIQLSETDDKLDVEFSVEIDGAQSLENAHAIASNLEDRIKQLDKKISAVTSHIEPYTDRVCAGVPVSFMQERLQRLLESILLNFPSVKSFKDLQVKKIDNTFSITLSCIFDKGLSLSEAHRIASKIEVEIKAKCPEIESISIHMEPAY